MNSFTSFFVLACILSSALGQQSGQIVDGPCSRFSVSTQQPFLKKLLSGPWYVYATYDYSDIVGLDCLLSIYKFTSDGNILNIESGRNLPTNVRQTFQNVFKFDQPGVGHYLYGEGENVLIPVTDYIHFYIEFSCVDLAAAKSDCYIGVFTRLPFPSTVTVNIINQFISAHNIDRNKLRYINHDKTRCLF